MRRRQLIEIEDQSWCPAAVRDGLTDYLQFITDHTEPYAPAARLLAEALRVIATLVSPVLPKSSREIFYQLNHQPSSTLADAAWGGLPQQHKLGKPVPVFPRIEEQV